VGNNADFLKSQRRRRGLITLERWLDAWAGAEARRWPRVLDLFHPSPASGGMTRGRSSRCARGRPEMVMALALIHHLAFVGNPPMENLAEFFRGLAAWLLIEFIPETDPRCACWRSSAAACTTNTTGRRPSDASPDTS
jgi:hypothetical protein